MPHKILWTLPFDEKVFLILLASEAQNHIFLLSKSYITKKRDHCGQPLKMPICGFLLKTKCENPTGNKFNHN